MNKILLISDSKGVFQVTKEITQGRYELIWCKYDFWGKGEYPDVDIVIMHFDVDMMERGTFEAIIKVKGKMYPQCSPFHDILQQPYTPMTIPLRGSGHQIS